MKESHIIWLMYTGATLALNEAIHHIDVNPENNHIDNLMLLDKRDHSRLHQYMRRGNLPIQKCKVGGCNNQSHALKVCSSHYTTYHKTCIQNRVCKAGRCSIKVRFGELCDRHHEIYIYSCIRPRTCKVGGCNNIANRVELCGNHYNIFSYNCVKKRK